MKTKEITQAQAKVIKAIDATVRDALEGDWHPVHGLNLRMVRFTSDDETRAVLLNVHVGAKPSDGTWHATATDGRQLLRTSISCAANPAISYQVPAYAFRLHTKTSAEVPLHVNPSKRTLALPAGGRWAVFSTSEWGTWPNCDQVIPGADKMADYKSVFAVNDPTTTLELWNRPFELAFDNHKDGPRVEIKFDGYRVKLPDLLVTQYFTVGDKSEPFRVGIDGRRLLQAIQSGIGEFRVRGERNGDMSAEPIVGNVDHGVHLLMPMRMS